MPYWTPPVNPYAAAFVPAPLLPTVKVETKGASAYEQERIGQRAETLQVVPINRGELERTEKGDYLVHHISVVTASESYTEDVVVTDVGAGSSSLVPVATSVSRESFDVEQVSWAPTAPVEVAPIEAPSGGGLDNWQYDWSWYTPETAPSYDVGQPDNTFYQPETAPPPVYYEPLPVEQAPVDQPQYVQPPPDSAQEYSDYLTQLEQMENEGAYGWGGPAV